MPAPLVTVVIPYFQREAGVLRKALSSVALQENCPGTVLALIVDDASPAPAAPEVAAVDWPDGIQAQVIQQANGGPGAARNTGLNSAPDGSDFIAFLDSDDEWSADHLARASTTLRQGFDFYFADHLQLGADVSAFRRAKRIQPTDHLALPSLDQAFAYQGDFFDQTLRHNVVGTSTVVISRPRLGKLRFRPEFTSAGEDYLFWMEASLHQARVAFSTKIEAVYGRGINVFAGSGWGTEGHLKRIHDETAFKKHVLRNFELDSLQASSVRTDLQRLRVSFWRDVIRRLRRDRRVPFDLIRRQLAVDPLTFIAAPAHLLVIARDLLSNAQAKESEKP